MQPKQTRLIYTRFLERRKKEKEKTNKHLNKRGPDSSGPQCLSQESEGKGSRRVCWMNKTEKRDNFITQGSEDVSSRDITSHFHTHKQTGTVQVRRSGVSCHPLTPGAL